MLTVQQQTELRSSLVAKLEMAEEALAYSNSNIEITMQMLIQVPKEIAPLLAKRAENAARISSLVEQIREQVQSDDERQLLDAACPRWICVDNYEGSPRLVIDGQGRAEEGAAAANILLPHLLDNTSWKAFLEFLRAQMEVVELEDEAKQEMANRTRELVRANQELKSIVAERKRVEERLSQLASIIELANDAIFIQTLGGTIVSWNKGAESIYGYSAREIVGRSRYMLVPPDQLDDDPKHSRKTHARRTNSALRGGPYPKGRESGSTFPYPCRPSKMRMGRLWEPLRSPETSATAKKRKSARMRRSACGRRAFYRSHATQNRLPSFVLVASPRMAVDVRRPGSKPSRFDSPLLQLRESLNVRAPAAHQDRLHRGTENCS